MLDFDGINGIVGTAEMIELGERYDLHPCSPDGAKRNPGKVVQQDAESQCAAPGAPDYASLHPGYDFGLNRPKA
jgi:hypothetical protein